MMYVASNYNWVTSDKNNVIIYNSFSGEIIQIKDRKKEDFLFLEESGRKVLSEKYTETFIKKGFIIPSDVDEINILEQNYLEYINKKELQLVILPTEQCNFRCVYCYELFERRFLTNENILKIKSFVDENIEKYSALRVSWFGGEPLLAMDIIEDLSNSFIATCKKHHKPYYSSITTNGYLLGKEMWTRIKKCHITDVQLTIDGLAITHDKQRVLISGENTWHQIINNLYIFRDQVKSKIIRIMLRTNITKDIYRNKKEYLLFLKENFGDDKRFHFFFHLVMDWGNISESEIYKQFCTENELYEFMEEAAELGLQMPVFRNFLLPFSRICFAAKKNSFVITSEGYLRKCTQRLYDDTKNYCGTLNERKEPEKICKDNYRSPECRKCKMLPTCMGNVCPLYEGKITDTCGSDISDVSRLIKILAKSERIKEIEI